MTNQSPTLDNVTAETAATDGAAGVVDSGANQRQVSTVQSTGPSVAEVQDGTRTSGLVTSAAAVQLKNPVGDGAVAVNVDGAKFTVKLTGGRPWGLRLQGGFEFAQRLRVAKVKPEGKAAAQGVRAGDLVLSINGLDTGQLKLNDALKLLQLQQQPTADGSLVLELSRSNRARTLEVERINENRRQHEPRQPSLQNSPERNVLRSEAVVLVADSRKQQQHQQLQQNSSKSTSSSEMYGSVERQAATMPPPALRNGPTAYSEQPDQRPFDRARSQSTEKTPPPSIDVWSPKGQRRLRTYHPVRFDLSSTLPAANKLSEISKLSAPFSTPGSSAASGQSQRQQAEAFWNTTSPFGWSPAVERRVCKRDSDASSANGSVESEQRGFHSLKQFWSSPTKTLSSAPGSRGRSSSRERDQGDGGSSCGGDDWTDTESGGCVSRKQAAAEAASVVQAARLPHVMEQPSPQNDFSLPTSDAIKKFTIDEFQRAFGPCRLLPSIVPAACSSPLRKKRQMPAAETTATATLTLTRQKPETAAGSTTPNQQRKVTFRLDSEKNGSDARKAVNGDGDETGDVRHRGSLPHTADELSKLTSAIGDYVRMLSASTPSASTTAFSTHPAVSKPRSASVVDASSSNSSSTGSTSVNFASSKDNSSKSPHITAVATPPDGVLNSSRSTPTAATAFGSSAGNPSVNGGRRVVPDVDVQLNRTNFDRPTTANDWSLTAADDVAVRRPISPTSTSGLPLAPDPIITLLTASRDENGLSRSTPDRTTTTILPPPPLSSTVLPQATSDLTRSMATTSKADSRTVTSTSERSLPTEDGSISNSSNTPRPGALTVTATATKTVPNNAPRATTTKSANPLQSDDDDMTYKDWYRKVFSTLHKNVSESDYDPSGLESNTVIPRRPSLKNASEADSEKKIEHTIRDAVKQVRREAESRAAVDNCNSSSSSSSTLPRGGSNGYVSSSFPQDTLSGDASANIKVKSVKSKSLDGSTFSPTPAASSTTLQPPDTMHRAVRNFELDVSARIAAAQQSSCHVGQEKILRQPVKSRDNTRSMQQPCKIVKPEDTSLFGDDYWLQFAQDLDRERLRATSVSRTSDANFSEHGSNRGREENKVLKLSQKFVIQPHQYDTTPFDRSRPPSLAPPAPPASNSATSAVGRAKALYPFTANDKRELSFRRGDYIELLRRIDGNWFEARLNGKKGLVPANYIEILGGKAEKSDTVVDSDNGDARVIALHNFSAKSADELTIKKGDVVTVTRIIDDNWYEGRLNGRQGLFPANYVEKMSEVSDRLSQTTSSLLDQQSSPSDQNDSNTNYWTLPGYRSNVDTLPHQQRSQQTVGSPASSTGNYHRSHTPVLGGSSQPPSAAQLSNFTSMTTPRRPTAGSSAEHDLFMALSSQTDRRPPIDSIDWSIDPLLDDGAGRNSRWSSLSAADSKRVTFDVQRRQQQQQQQQKAMPGPVTASVSSRDKNAGVRVGQSNKVGSGRVSKSADADDNDAFTRTAAYAGVSQQPKFIPSPAATVEPPVRETSTWRRVMYDYHPRHEDELELREGDMVSIIRSFDDGWCVGMLNRTKAVGTFPGNYIL